jgi:hypothetical protein
MDRVFSTRIDESTAELLDRLSKARRIPKKRIVEDAIRLYGETLQCEPDPFDRSFGAWQRPEPATELYERMRATFESSMHRRRR